MKQKICQGSTEFLIITGAVLFLFVIFFVAVQNNIADKYKEEETLVVKNLALSIQDEVNLAAESSNGYKREFSVPEKISGKNYDISIVENSIYIRTDRTAMALEIGTVIGSIKKGVNLIRKENEKVYLN